MTRPPTRRTRSRPSLWRLAPLALLVAACLDDDGVGPDGPRARLALRAQFGAVAVTGLRLEGGYLRSDQSSVALAPQLLPLPADRSPGAQATMPITLDLAACLADPLAVPGDGACTITLALVLLDGSREVDRVVIGPLVLRPGETATPAPVQLREAANVDVTAPASVTCVNPGRTLQLTARLLDDAGDELTGRTFTWASGTPAVATVDPATGLVTGVALGSATISATAGGRTGQITVTVCPTARIALAPSALAFEWYGGSALPDPRQVAVTNGESGPLAGLTVERIVYSGPVTDWLRATLSSAASPATLTLRPTRTNLADGSYTAAVLVASNGAANSPQAVTVSYTVRDISNYSFFLDTGDSSSTFLFMGDEVGLRAVLLDPSEDEVTGVPVSWAVSPANAGTLTPSSATGGGATYEAGSFQGSVEITVSAGPLSATLDITQNFSSGLRLAPPPPRRSTTTTPARRRAPGGTP